MTIKELMDRVAGDDLEWVELDGAMLREVANDKVEMATPAPFFHGGPVHGWRIR